MYGLSRDVIHKIKDILAAYPQIDKAILYGSRAKSSYRKNSDIDMTLIGTGLTLANSVYPLMDALDDLLLPYEFDISIFEHIDNPALIEHVHDVGKVFYKRVRGWPLHKLYDVCQIDKEQYRGGSLPYVGMEDIEGHTGRFLGELSPKIVASSTFQFSKHHVLYGRLRPYLNKVFVPEFEGHCSSEIFPLKPNEKLDKKYLFYWLTSEVVVQAIDKTCTGTRMPRANVKEVLTFDFPLPPLPEQKCIVAILDQAFADIDKARTNAEQNLKNARELFESYLQQMFSRRGEGWVEVQLGDKLYEVKNETAQLESFYRNKLSCLDELKKSLLQKAFTGELTNKNKGQAA